MLQSSTTYGGREGIIHGEASKGVATLLRGHDRVDDVSATVGRRKTLKSSLIRYPSSTLGFPGCV